MKEILFPRQIEAAITGNPILSLLGDAESSLFIIAKGESLYFPLSRWKRRRL